MNVQQIKTEGRRIDPVRNIERLWLALTTKAQNGASIEGHLVRPGDEPVVIEVYADRLDAVLERTRTAAHREAHAQAVRMHETQAAEERRQRKLPPDADMGVTWNGCPEIHYAILGYRSGLPPLESCEVVHPQTKARMDAREWQRLDAAKQREWLVDAPVTPMNAAQRANEHLADTIAKAIGQAAEARASGNPKR